MNKAIDIEKFIDENKSELCKLPSGNCYFANLVISMLLREIDPTIVFGSFLGFSVKRMINPWDVLCDYVDSYFDYTWGIKNEFIIKLKVEDFDSIERFKGEIFKQLKNKEDSFLLGICLAAENVFFRDDIDLEFWGLDYISHFFLIYDLDFDNDTCMVLDATPPYGDSEKKVIAEEITLTKILSYLRKDKIYLKKDKDFVWLFDVDALMKSITNGNRENKDMIKKCVNSLYNQSYNRLENKYKTLISPILWLKNKWDDFENLDDSFQETWFSSRLNIFQIISAHRYYVSLFIEKYAGEYFNFSIEELLNLLKKEEELFNKIRYLCYKLEISNKKRNVIKLKSSIKDTLSYIDCIEVQIANFIVKNIKI